MFNVTIRQVGIEEREEIIICCHEISEYKTIYDNYLYRLNKHNNETKIKNLMYKKICEVKQQKCITNYRIYKELNLNAGNVNSFLKYGNTDKLSVETVRKVLTFINEY